ncbi:MAG: MFS transporter [Thalassobaculaceae bacterium]
MSSSSRAETEEVGLRHWLILATVQITTLTFGMTITSANVVLPQLKGAMAATSDQIAWVVTFNLVATAIATPLTGWLAQTLGWRNLLFVSLGGFTIFSALCGLSDSLESLVLCRVGQGAFGAPLDAFGARYDFSYISAQAASYGSDDVGYRWCDWSCFGANSRRCCGRGI